MAKQIITLEDLADFTDAQFEHLTSLFPDVYSHHEMLAYAALAKLTEETGELSEAVLSEFQRQRKTKSHKTTSIEKEAADVIVVALLIAHQFNIDIPKMLQAKIEYLENRRSTDA